MKKFVGITLCLLLLVALVVPNVAMAEVATNASDIIYFLNPTAIAVVGDYLFVADNIEDGKSVILSFDVSGTKLEYSYTYEVDGNVTNLSAKGNNGLYAVMSDKVVEYSIGANLSVVKNIDVADAINFVYGTLNERQGEYYATDKQFYRQDLYENKFTNIGLNTLSKIKDIVAIGNYVYYLYEKEDGSTVCKRFNGRGLSSDDGDVFNKSTEMSSLSSIGTFVWDDKIGLFSEDEIQFIEITTSCSSTPLMDYNTDNGTICDVAADNGRLFVLNSNHKVEIYSGQPENFTLDESIGSEKLERDVPAIEDINSFTLVKSKGYPTNIIFMTVDEATSVETLIEGATDEYIILGLNEEDPNFYYVLYGDKFGWVKRSDGATDVEHDGKLQIINTKLTDGVVEYKAKFTSLNAVYVYPLPRASSTPTMYTQSASSMTEVTVLQRFTEDETVWYYVEYAENTKGFVKEENLGRIYLSANLDGADIVGQRKINSTLFEAVRVYDNPNPETMTKDHTAVTSEGNEIKLYSGTRVTVISEKDGVAFIQIVYGDGTLAYGYIQAKRLIGVNDITTNATVGLILLGIAIVLTVILVIVFVERRKKNAPKSDSHPRKEKKENQ